MFFLKNSLFCPRGPYNFPLVLFVDLYVIGLGFLRVTHTPFFTGWVGDVIWATLLWKPLAWNKTQHENASPSDLTFKGHTAAVMRVSGLIERLMAK